MTTTGIMRLLASSLVNSNFLGNVVATYFLFQNPHIKKRTLVYVQFNDVDNNVKWGNFSLLKS